MARASFERLIGVVFSDPEAQFTAMTVEDELVFGMENIGLTVQRSTSGSSGSRD